MFDDPPVYPAQYISEHKLRDGAPLLVRPIRPTDDPLMLEMFHCFSRETIYYRFFTYIREMPPARLRRFTNIDYEHEFALVAMFFDGTHDRIVGVARYVRDKMKRNEAEVAIVVQDDFQSRGIGTMLLRLLHRPASENGIDTFVGYVMVENEKIFRMIDRVGYRYHKDYSSGAIRVVVLARENPLWDTPPAPIGPSGPKRTVPSSRRMSVSSGRHALLRTDFTAGDPPGAWPQLVPTARGLKLQSGAKQAQFTSLPMALPFPCDRVVMSWSADTPPGSAIDFRFRVRAAGDWSEWYEMGSWGVKTAGPRRDTDPVFGRLRVDELRCDAPVHELQCSAAFTASHDGESPKLRLICFAVSDTSGCDTATENPGGLRAARLDVPWISQFRPEDVRDPAKRAAGVCAPTSVTMTLRFHGVRTDVDAVAELAYDPASKLFGNWAYLAATAASFGRTAWVERFGSWKPVRDYIDAGMPVVISIAYPPQTFRAEPDRSTDGHLLVVIGFDDDGNPIVNDPGTIYADRGAGYVYMADELGAAFFGHGGTAIIIK